MKEKMDEKSEVILSALSKYALCSLQKVSDLLRFS